MRMIAKTNMKNYLLPLVSWVALVSGFFIAFNPSDVKASVPLQAALCDGQTGLFKGVAAIEPEQYGGSKEKAAAAHTWLEKMMEPPGSAEDGSIITLNQPYDAAYTGPVAGTFELANPPPKVSESPLQVASPAQVGDNYRGFVSGVSTQVGSDFEVRAYLMVDIEYHQAEVIATPVGEDGSWTVDLSPVSPERQGSWRFRLYEKSTNTQVGLSWPRSETYQNITIEAYSVADIEYLQHVQPARADNTWSFPSMGTGEKLFKIVNTATGDVLGQYTNTVRTGLVRSYDYLPGQDGHGTDREYNSYAYDQALALLVALGAQDKALADELLGGLAATQESSGEVAGAFRSYTDQRNIMGGGQDYYVGSNSFVAYALLKYYQTYGDQYDVVVMIERVLAFFERHKTTEGGAAGLYRGGMVTRDDHLRPVMWHSTEHNTDLWHVFELTGRMLDEAYIIKADMLAETIVDTLWSESNQRFDQGFGDDYKALDTASWGAIFLAATGDYERAAVALAATSDYKVTRGANAGYTIYDNPSSYPTIWLEGTFGVGLAQRYFLYPSRDVFNQTIDDTQSLQAEGGAWQYTLDYDAEEERTDAYSVASTAWYLLTTEYPDMMWSECRTVEDYAVPGGGELTPPSRGDAINPSIPSPYHETPELAVAVPVSFAALPDVTRDQGSWTGGPGSFSPTLHQDASGQGSYSRSGNESDSRLRQQEATPTSGRPLYQRMGFWLWGITGVVVLGLTGYWLSRLRYFS